MMRRRQGDATTLVNETAAAAEGFAGPPPAATLPSTQPPAQPVTEAEGVADGPDCSAADIFREGYRAVQGSPGSTTQPVHAPAGGSNSPAKAQPAREHLTAEQAVLFFHLNDCMFKVHISIVLWSRHSLRMIGCGMKKDGTI